MGSVFSHACAGGKLRHRMSVVQWLAFGSLAVAACKSDMASPEDGTSTGQPSTTVNSSQTANQGGTAKVDEAGKGGTSTTTQTSNENSTSTSGSSAAVAGNGGATAAGAGGSAGDVTATNAGGASGMMSGMDAGVEEPAMSMMDAGGRMNAASDEDAGCVPPEKPLDVSRFPKCSEEVCPAQDSVCFPISTLRAIVSTETIDLLANCDSSSKCVPIELASAAGRSLLTKCTSLNGAEGRCTSPCVPLVAQQASLLPQDVCTGSDLCAPCYDPRTGEDTLACRQGCDPGPSEAPKVFDKCCSDRGLCVPPALAGDQAKNLDQESCSEGTLCAPTELTDPTYQAKSCDSIDGAEGRCISTCVGGSVAKQKDRLPNAGCGANEVCAPCFDPVTGEDTGACTVNGDMPKKPKQVFQTCCGMSGDQPVGVCVTPDLAGSQASILRQESCPSGRLCAPVKKAQDPNYQFPMCTSLLGRGACVNSCIPDQTQAAILTRSGCSTGELCAPCELLGSPTGACD